jgi:hypothetical protein
MVQMNPPVVLGLQHAPCFGHGLGVQAVAVISTPPGKGHGTAVEHAAVAGSQQTCVTVIRHGVICEHVRPSEKTSGGWQCDTSGWIEHSPVEGSQHAPCVPGGHGLGTQVVPAGNVALLAQGVPSWIIEQTPVIGSQQTTVCGGHVMPVQVVLGP